MSIFTSNEVMDMSLADDSGERWIYNNINIMKKLESHEIAISRNEVSIEEMKEHIDN